MLRQLCNRRKCLGSAAARSCSLGLLLKDAACCSSPCELQLRGYQGSAIQNQHPTAAARGRGQTQQQLKQIPWHNGYTAPKNAWPIVISNFPKTALREDIQAFLQPLDVIVNEIRPSFDALFRPMRYWIMLNSQEDQQLAVQRDGQFLGARAVSVKPGFPEQMESDLMTRFANSSRGRYVLLTGLTMKCTADDVMKLFRGFDMLSVAISMMKPAGRGHQKNTPHLGKESDPESDQAAILRFANFEEANRAVRHSQGGFVRSHKTHMRILP